MWAEENGVDLACVVPLAGRHHDLCPAVVRHEGLGDQLARPEELDHLIAAGTLPRGRETGELLVHRDEQTGRDVPDANAAFVYVTREGTMGLIETTDRVTRTADLTGLPAGQPPSGVGFKVGVRFNLKWIVP